MFSVEGYRVLIEECEKLIRYNKHGLEKELKALKECSDNRLKAVKSNNIRNFQSNISSASSELAIWKTKLKEKEGK